MKRLLLIVVTCGFVLAVVPSAGARATKIVYFRMPSKNIACAWIGDVKTPYLRCDLLSGLKPKPSGKCTEGVWSGVWMSKTSKARAICISDTVYDNHAPFLAYGHTWRHYGFTCTSKQTGLRCTNTRGHGFFLSRQRWSVH